MPHSNKYSQIETALLIVVPEPVVWENSLVIPFVTVKVVAFTVLSTVPLLRVFSSVTFTSTVHTNAVPAAHWVASSVLKRGKIYMTTQQGAFLLQYLYPSLSISVCWHVHN